MLIITLSKIGKNQIDHLPLVQLGFLTFKKKGPIKLNNTINSYYYLFNKLSVMWC